ncbi:HCP-like protein [Tuber magnatum]|uniref:HCP-like protein n=1 Tax=Tuber magnatum TaxID=42249 RepID=A0A317SCU6_9PEZI|nr:HCP-like protein [Tuber magnatum]
MFRAAAPLPLHRLCLNFSSCPRSVASLLLPQIRAAHPSRSNRSPKPVVPRRAAVAMEIPPAALLSAYKSGASPISPSAAQALINDYAGRTTSPPSEALGEKFCSDHGVTPEALTILTHLLLRLNAPGSLPLLRHLLTTCAHMNVPSAVVRLHTLLTAQVRRGGASTMAEEDLAAVTKRLARIAPEHAGGAFRMGESTEMAGELDRAEEWFEKAGQGEVMEGWVRLGILRRNRGDLQGAREVFEKAAEMGSAKGCYFLAQAMGEREGRVEGAEEGEYIKGVGGKWLGLLTRAGAGGVVEAAYELGSYWRERETKFAEEWFLVAASQCHAESIVALAQLLMEKGNISSAKIWAQKAANLEGEVGAYGMEILQELSRMEKEKQEGSHEES